MNGHARLSPSNKRWPICPGSVREEANYPDIPGEAAIDGTGSHLLLEMCLKNNVPAINYDQQIIGANHPENIAGWLVGIERIKRVQTCLDYIKRRVGELKLSYPDCDIKVESESKSNPGGMFGRDDWHGTCDITISCFNEDHNRLLFIEVIDYKDGRGRVNVKDNSQLVSYLVGKMRPFISSGSELVRPFHTHFIDNCRMTIVQPKTTPAVRYECSADINSDFSPRYALREAEKLSLAASATDNPEAPLISGKHCQWCKANPKRGGHCTVALNKSLKTVNNMSNIESPLTKLPAFEYIAKVVANPKSLTSEQLSELLSAKEALMTAFTKCEIEIQERIESGQHVTGYAMYPGRSSRKWNKPEEEIVKKLKSRKLKQDDIYPKKLASPAAILKSDKLTDAQKKKIELDLITTVAGKLTLKKVAQSTTKELQSTEDLFPGVPKPLDNKTEVSFF